jgi:ADP-ribose pyrophosphatase YjhB (NUDIX family)
LIGGRLLYCESLEEAVRRQIRETLGTMVRPLIPPGLQPIYIAEYSPSKRSPFAFDSRKHSVGLTYVVDLEGSPKPRGEAKRFKWFKMDSLPSRKKFGFDQDLVAEACITLLQLRASG